MAFLAPIAGVAAGSAGATAAGLGVAGALGGGLALGKALSRSSRKLLPAVTAAPAKPKPEDSVTKAKEQATRRRRIAARTGGITIGTSPLGARVSQENITQPQLVETLG